MSSTTPSREEALEALDSLRLAVPRLATCDREDIATLRAFIESSAPDAAPAPSAQGPEELWLQLHGDCSDAELDEPVDYTVNDAVTWCWHPIHNSDVRYIRADLAPPTGGAADERAHEILRAHMADLRRAAVELRAMGEGYEVMENTAAEFVKAADELEPVLAALSSSPKEGQATSERKGE